MNDNHDPATEALFGLFAPWLKRALREFLDAHPTLRRTLTSSRAVLRVAPGDEELADDVTRARARDLLQRRGGCR